MDKEFGRWQEGSSGMELVRLESRRGAKMTPNALEVIAPIR